MSGTTPKTRKNPSPQTTEQKKRKRIGLATKFLFFLSLLCFSFCSFTYISVKYAEWVNQKKTELHTWFIEKKYEIADSLDLVRYDTRIVEVTNDADVEHLIEVYSAKYGINPVILKAMINKESAGNPFRVRYEQTWKNSYSTKFPKQTWMNDIEYDMIFSSYGFAQVGFPIWNEFCHVQNPTELLNPRTNIECAAKIMNKCLYEQRTVKPSDVRLRLCFRLYNGSGDRAERYADDMMARLARNFVTDDIVAIAAERVERENKQWKETVQSAKMTPINTVASVLPLVLPDDFDAEEKSEDDRKFSKAIGTDSSGDPKVDKIIKELRDKETKQQKVAEISTGKKKHRG